MFYGVAADLLVVAHLAFVGFVVLGGFAVPRWPRLAWAHVPAVAWGVGIELTGAICPLTPMEQWLRIEAGAVGYEGDFIAHYLLPVLYPAGLTRQAQWVLGALAGGINLIAYVRWIVVLRAARARRGRGAGA
jgi:hypothetical protein